MSSTSYQDIFEVNNTLLAQLTVSTGGSILFNDDIQLLFGTGSDYELHYDLTDTRFEFNAGTTLIWYINDGVDLMQFPRDIILNNDIAVLFGAASNFHLEYDSVGGYLQLSDGSNDFMHVVDDGTTATFKFFDDIELDGNLTFKGIASTHNLIGENLLNIYAGSVRIYSDETASETDIAGGNAINDGGQVRAYGSTHGTYASGVRIITDATDEAMRFLPASITSYKDLSMNSNNISNVGQLNGVTPFSIEGSTHRVWVNIPVFFFSNSINVGSATGQLFQPQAVFLGSYSSFNNVFFYVQGFVPMYRGYTAEIKQITSQINTSDAGIYVNEFAFYVTENVSGTRTATKIFDDTTDAYGASAGTGTYTLNITSGSITSHTLEHYEDDNNDYFVDIYCRIRLLDSASSGSLSFYWLAILVEYTKV